VPVSFDAPGDIGGIIETSQKHSLPVTWLIYTSSTRPQTVARYYKDRVIGRLPASHELGLHVHFDDHNLDNYQPDPTERRELIIQGVEVLRKYDIIPTSFRAGCWCLQASDIEVLEEMAILIDSSPCPGFRSPNHPGHGDWRNLDLRDAYHPAYDSLFRKGDAKLMVLPICSSPEPGTGGHVACGYLEYAGWNELKPILDWYVKNGKALSMGTHDGRRADSAGPSPGEVLDRVAPYLQGEGFDFVTLTQFWEANSRGDTE